MIEKHVKEILKALGQNAEREGLIRTPTRVDEALRYMTSGYDMEVKLERTYTEKANMVVANKMSFMSLCEHHLLPFYGHVHIAYIPHRHKVTGLSKLDQLVRKYSLRLQIQERMTQEIADEIDDILQPKGVFVVSRAIHTCKYVEGLPVTPYVCSVTKGIFLSVEAPRMEALKLMGYGDDILG